MGDEGVIYSLIFMMLPNVRSLDLHRVRSSQFCFFGTIKFIAKSESTEALSRLTEVRLLQGSDCRPEEFDWVRTFATLPSIKSIQAWDIGPVCEGSGPFYDEVNEVNIIDDLYGDVHIPDENPDAFHCCFNTLCHDSRLPLSPKTSAVSHLTFVNCIIRTRRLVRFLESLWALESFDYLSENRSVDSSEPEEIIDTLLAHARYSLQTLRLRSWYEGLSVSGSVTLADFEVTKEVAIACDQLVGTSKLADALPPSVEKVHLSRLNTNVHYVVEHDVLEMTITKAERLPNLKEFTIELHQIDEGLDAEMIAMLKHKCEDVGVLLHITITSPVTTKWFPLMDLSEADFSEADL